MPNGPQHSRRQQLGVAGRLLSRGSAPRENASDVVERLLVLFVLDRGEIARDLEERTLMRRELPRLLVA
jgi:hypothetical protein